MPKIIKSAELVSSKDVVLVPGDNSTDSKNSRLSDSTLEETMDSQMPELSEDEDSKKEKSEEILEKVQEEKTQEVSRKILQNAREEREKILSSARSEADSIRQEAYKDAYTDVMREKSGEINSLLEELKSLMSTLSGQQQEFFDEYEKGLTELSVDIAEKVVKASVAQNAALMSNLVKDAVSAVRNADWISIEVSSRLPQLAEQLRSELSAESGFPQATEIISKDVPEGTCVIRTPNGIVDASVSQQFQNLNTILEAEK